MKKPNRPHLVIDIEADGPCPGIYSMVCFGVVDVFDQTKTFYGETAPLKFGNHVHGSAFSSPEALAVSGFTREQHLAFPHPLDTMTRFAQWLADNYPERPTVWSDNPGFDWMFLTYYIQLYIEYADRPTLFTRNPLGHSCRRIGDLYAGHKQAYQNSQGWKKHRRAPHDHNPVNDALGNAQALLHILGQMEK